MRDAREQLDRALAREPWLERVSIAVFGGVVDPARLPFPLNRSMQASDARDWEAIRSWADELAERFALAVAA
jgi:menaquinone-dependent protoporphyrinogen IX oxidase